MFGKRSATASSNTAPQTSTRFAVLYDGWALVYAPGSPPALHLLEILEALPEGIEPWVALPVEADPASTARMFPALTVILRDDGESESKSEQTGKSIFPISSAVPNTPAGQLRWEQQVLPSIARRVGARLLHLTTQSAPLVCPVPCVISPTQTDSPGEPPRGLFNRLRVAFGEGAEAGVHGLLWPDDLPAPPGSAAVMRLPPIMHSAFRTPQPHRDDLPETYILIAHPLDALAITKLIATWSWISSGLGEDCWLLAADLEPAAFEQLRFAFEEAEIVTPLTLVKTLSPAERAAVFQQAAVVLHLGSAAPWGDDILQALGSARPIAAQETPLLDARVGPAGYLTPSEDARALGAAVITLMVNEEVAEEVCQSALRRAEGWHSEQFGERLKAIYQQVASAA